MIFVSFGAISYNDQTKPIHRDRDNICYLYLPEGIQFQNAIEVTKKCKKGNIIHLTGFSKIYIKETLTNEAYLMDSFVVRYCDFSKQIKIRYPLLDNLSYSVMCVYNGFKTKSFRSKE